MKVFKTDKSGASPLIMIGAVAAVIVILLAAFTFLAAGGGGKDNEEFPDKPGGGEDPIIGYIDITATIKFDNRNWFTQQVRSLDGVQASFVSGSPGINFRFLDDLAFWNSANEDFTVEFIVSSDYSTKTITDKVTTKIHVGANQVKFETVSPDKTIYVKYPGTYTVKVILYDEHGNVVGRDSKQVIV